MNVGGPQPPVTALEVMDTHTHRHETAVEPGAASDPSPKELGQVVLGCGLLTGAGQCLYTFSYFREARKACCATQGHLRPLSHCGSQLVLSQEGGRVGAA